MHNFRLATPYKKPEVLVLKDFSMLESFLWKDYNPNNVDNWNDFLISDKQPTCPFSDDSNLNVQQYIDTVLSKYPDFSFQTLIELSETETRCLTDMFLKMRLDKLQEHFWDYILFYLFFEAYPYNRYDSYLKVYAEKRFDFMKKYGFKALEMITNAAHRLWLKNIDFAWRMEILRLFIAFNEWDHEQLFSSSVQSSSCDPKYMNDLSLWPIWPKSIWACWYTIESSKHDRKHDIHKNEYSTSDAFLDAPLALCLYYKGEQIAAISGMERKQGEFVIHQMQATSRHVYTPHGVSKPKTLHPITHDIPRQDILFSTMTSLLYSLGMKKIYIQPSDKNFRTKHMYTVPDWSEEYKHIGQVVTNIPHLSQKIAHQIYDVFAEKKWYHKDRSWFWVENKKEMREKRKPTSKLLSNTA